MSMIDFAARDFEHEQELMSRTAAEVSTQGVWQWLALAADKNEFGIRLQLAETELRTTAAKFGHPVEALVQQYTHLFETLDSARTAKKDDDDKDDDKPAFLKDKDDDADSDDDDADKDGDGVPDSEEDDDDDDDDKNKKTSSLHAELAALSFADRIAVLKEALAQGISPAEWK